MKNTPKDKKVSSLEYYYKNKDGKIKEYRGKNRDKISNQQRLWREKNKEKHAQSQNEYYKLNYEKNKSVRIKKFKEWCEANPEKRIEERRRNTQNEIMELRDTYIVRILKKDYGFSIETIKEHPELIINIRNQIKIKRLLKTKKDGKKVN